MTDKENSLIFWNEYLKLVKKYNFYIRADFDCKGYLEIRKGNGGGNKEVCPGIKIRTLSPSTIFSGYHLMKRRYRSKKCETN